MNNKVLYGTVGAVLLLIIIALGAYVYQQRIDNTATNNDTTTNTSSDNTNKTIPDETKQVSSNSLQSEKGVTITVTSPSKEGSVSSPLAVTGTVPGSWSNEGQFALRLLDNNSNVLAEASATLEGDWMSQNQVPFKGELSFTAPAAGTMGLLVLEKANPSGMQDNADSVSFPVKF